MIWSTGNYLRENCRICQSISVSFNGLLDEVGSMPARTGEKLVYGNDKVRYARCFLGQIKAIVACLAVI